MQTVSKKTKKAKTTLDELVKKTVKLDSRFAKKLDKRARFMDLVEEVGELAQAMLIVDREKLTNDPKKRKTEADIADALCDILYDLVMLSEEYKLDLGEEYKSMLVRLSTRVEKGEFGEVGG